jgi:peptidoglycan/xylan/chitin deacetylase (PgdA/CDA1 family)
MTLSRRNFISATAALAINPALLAKTKPAGQRAKAQIAITYDLEMSRHYPKRGMLEWDYQKGNLDEATKSYALEAGKIAAKHEVRLHFFAVGRVLEQANVDWLTELSKQGHAIGNHTYDHINVHAATAEATQFRFQRSPWLVAGKSVHQVIRDNVKVTDLALRKRAGIKQNGFRTPGGFYDGLDKREDLQDLFLDLGFKWVSSKYPSHLSKRSPDGVADDIFTDIVRAQQYAQPYKYSNGLIEIPMSPISDVTAFRSNLWELSEFKKAIQGAIEWAIDNTAVFDFLCHPSCLVVEDPQHETLRMMCDIVKNAEARAEIVTMDKIADTTISTN